MTAITQSQDAISRREQVEDASMPFWHQVSMMTWRSLYTLFREPFAVLPNLVISAFFLLVYEASLGDAASFLPGLSSKSYLGFILPLSIVSASLNSSAGQAMVRDIENGYFDKLLLTPISRSALLLGHILAGATVLLLQTILITVIALLMGLQSATGIAGLLFVLAFAVLIGTGFSGFTMSIALRTGNSAATQGASFIFFPLSFLTATFVPYELLGGWLKVAATVNPITYILDAMRGVLIEGWDVEKLLIGAMAAAVLAAIPFMLSLLALKSRTARK